MSSEKVDKIVAALGALHLVGDGGNGDALVLALDHRRTAAQLVSVKKATGGLSANNPTVARILNSVAAELVEHNNYISSDSQRDSVNRLRALYDLGPTPTVGSEMAVHRVDQATGPQDYELLKTNLTRMAGLAAETKNYDLCSMLETAASELDTAASRATVLSLSKLNVALRTAAERAAKNPDDAVCVGIATSLELPPTEATPYLHAAKLAAMGPPPVEESAVPDAEQRRIFVGGQSQRSDGRGAAHSTNSRGAPGPGQGVTATGRTYEVPNYERSQGIDRSTPTPT